MNVSIYIAVKYNENQYRQMKIIPYFTIREPHINYLESEALKHLDYSIEIFDNDVPV